MTDKQYPELYDQIQAFAFDDAAAEFPFAARLAKENDWKAEFTERVIEEYKKFMFLAVAAGHPVTPSDQVDQAWHLHLLYTDSYWNQFCKQVLGKAIHHGPTKGGSQETLKFVDWYGKTLDSYRRFFRQPPPQDIWPDASDRFGVDICFKRVNTRRNWVIPKHGMSCFIAGVLTILLIIVAVSGQAFVQALTRTDQTPGKNASSRFGISHGFITDFSGRTNFQLVSGSRQTNQRIYPIQTDKSDPWHSRAKTRPTSAAFDSGAVLLIVFVLVVLAIVGATISRRCPQCGKSQTLQKTGATKKGSWFKSGQEEWQCRE